MSAEVDETDEKIIRILQADSRRAFVDIANEIGLSESAVRRRVKNLVDRTIIRLYH
jgi:DNA-binding Lrp family transcriptional regulator